MRNYIIKRIFWGFIVLLGVSVLSFAILYFTPGDPALALLPAGASQQEVNELREELGLNKPIQVQYLIYMQGLIKGDLGKSLFFKRPNLDIIKERVPATLLLSSTAIVIVLFFIPLGIIAGIKQGTFTDLLIMLFALLGQAMSPVWLGILSIYIFSVKLKILPSFGYGTIQALILPAFVMAVPLAALVTRLSRAAAIDVLSENYILAIRAKGIGEKKIIMPYVLKNVLIPVTTIIGLQFAVFMGGAMVIETIFFWPGIGRLAMNAIYGRDFPLIRAIMLVVAAFFVSINLLVDIFCTLLDPRIKLN